MRRIKVTGKKNVKKRAIKVYVASSLRPEVVSRVDKLLPQLAKQYGSPVLFLRPTGVDMKDIMSIVREDVKAIDECDQLWLIGDYGRDVSWEAGYAMANKKPVVIYKDYTNAEKLESDAMFLIGHDFDLLSIKDLR